MLEYSTSAIIQVLYTIIQVLYYTINTCVNYTQRQRCLQRDSRAATLDGFKTLATRAYNSMQWAPATKPRYPSAPRRDVLYAVCLAVLPSYAALSYYNIVCDEHACCVIAAGSFSQPALGTIVSASCCLRACAASVQSWERSLGFGYTLVATQSQLRQLSIVATPSRLRQLSIGNNITVQYLCLVQSRKIDLM